MTSPTPGYLPVPSYDDVTGGGSPARLTHTDRSMRSRANAARVLRMVSAARTLPAASRPTQSRSLRFRRLIPPDCAAVAVVGVQIKIGFCRGSFFLLLMPGDYDPCCGALRGA